MEIYFHNTGSGGKERFKPLIPDEVSIYACGPTVYGLAHIGNALPAVIFDVLVRLLRLEYRRVRYVRNVTDVDDKINAAASAAGLPIAELADRYTAEYNRDLAALGVLEPDVTPRATRHIDEIIAMIECLIDAGHAYQADGHVLFHVPSDPDYGSLSKRSLEELLIGARVEVAPYKQDPKDFVLWKPSGPELPGWDSPWGRGRPGWHIECSAMIRKHLGAVIDIHGGGNDLTFPHHENESAQSRCASGGVASVRYWLHNGMLTMGTAKMSKSAGNIITIRALLDRHDGETLRYALLSGHYRQSLVWDDGLIAQAEASLDTLYQALRDDDGNHEPSAVYASAAPEDFPSAVLNALCDDLNTPKALAALHALAAETHRATSPGQARESRSRLRAGGWLLGLLGKPASEHFQGGAEVDAAAIERLIEARSAARAAHDYHRADAVRKQLAALGVELEDTRAGTRWKIRPSGKAAKRPDPAH